ncbi:M24 family metallopeptidase [Thermus thermamylovorans]|uniref:Aminopeptidase P family protein n=1 Tax=Thermus thermamylovorans TaxID=2509362 RepID=A0A4Q9B8F5_9DEIN|nr:M24 family metallopeptidase [Thermus thermamylovorans]TBH21158.1 aminopeptidase P family protein [Thermus thermamylovorans]
MDLARLQAALREEGLDGWLLFSFGRSNALTLEVLALVHLHLTRRFAYFLPREGEPALLCHAIEESLFPPLPGGRRTYHSWQGFVEELARMLRGARRVAVEYVPGGMIPYLSRVDGGTLDLLRGLGLELASSWPLLLLFQTWDEERLRSHLRAVRGLVAAKERALAYLRENPRATEGEVQRAMAEVLAASGLVFDHPPMAAFGRNAANPHHAPGEKRLEEGEVVLLDLWAKEPGGVYADLTWMAGLRAPEAAHRAFRAVVRARDEALRFLAEAYREGRRPKGYEVDRLARGVLEAEGYGAFVRHRTGHHLGEEVHGSGPHLDDLETHDFRPLVPGLAFTVEPGLYLEAFGVRTEVDVYLRPEGPEVTTPQQQGITPL